jgi:hypothetical protein
MERKPKNEENDAARGADSFENDAPEIDPADFFDPEEFLVSHRCS